MYREKMYERTVKVYRDLLKETILNIQTNYDIKVKEYLIRAEMQKRDFTKRQLNILTLICTFSFNYGKETALLQISDFSLTGISGKKVTGEINKLIEMDVISWDTDFNEFRINEPIKWKDVPYHNHYDDKRSRELFFLNLKHAGVDVNPILDKLKELNL